MTYPKLTLKKDRDASIKYRHPWIFSGAFTEIPQIENGSLVHIAASTGEILATGTYSKDGSIAVRAFDFKEVEIDRDWLKLKIMAAEEYRKQLGYSSKETSGYRMIFSESDSLPGLVVDRYADVFVMQISTTGMEKLRETIVELLIEIFSPKAIVEKSESIARHQEGLEDKVEVHYGKLDGPIKFKEHGVTFFSDPLKGQKTGFFLDQKDLRQQIKALSKGKKVLNLFSYSGASGVAAMLGGAKSVTNVDISAQALELCEMHKKEHKLKNFDSIEADLFTWLSEKHEDKYDMVIMDPPALMKSHKDKEHAQKAYHFINRAAMRLVEDEGIFISSSCSQYFSEDDLLLTLRRGSVQNNSTLKLLEVTRQSPDHPVSLYFPESSYLKSAICLLNA